MNRVKKVLNLVILFLIVIGINQYCYADIIMTDPILEGTSIITGSLVIICAFAFLSIMVVYSILKLTHRKTNIEKESNLENVFIDDENNKEIFIESIVHKILVIVLTSIIMSIISILAASDVNNENLLFSGYILLILYIVFIISLFINNQKFKKIARLLFIVMVVFTASIEIYNSITSRKSQYNDLENWSKEMNIFNNNFTIYKGRQIGSQVKVLLNYCIENAKEYEDEEDKVPSIDVAKVSAEDINEYEANNDEDSKTYINNISKIMNKIEIDHYYKVNFEKDAKTGYVNKIYIVYDKSYEIENTIDE